MTVTLQTILQKVLVLTLLPLLTIGYEEHRLMHTTNNFQTDMTTLSIDFQDGFDKDSILCTVNELTVFNKKAVTTSKLTGLADSINIEVEKGKAHLEITIVNRNLSKLIKLNITEESYIGISLAGDSISYIRSAEPFGYG
ncbi:hypothetical protein [Maribellus sediminis]|uniref:hypothetical protein n=1 Tax=Maribellus sediminis TaxID=2696285 RepID=UPI001431E56E|nr:hypothetical protein [Maribellus sediminis]